MRRTIAFLTTAVLLAAYATHADEAKQREALSELQAYVGDWRGVGQVRRGSTTGAWTESCGWAWKFDDDSASLVFQIKDAKYFESGQLQTTKGKSFELTALTSDKKNVKYTGSVNEGGSLVLTAENAPKDKPARISIRQVASGKRMIMLYERQVSDSRYTRMSEVGYTRKNSNFGKGTNYIECIVTGGVGTMPVTHKGKTYYVCCTGCRDYLNDDPEGAIAEYLERKAEEQKQKQEKG